MQIEITGVLEHQLIVQANLAGIDIHEHVTLLLSDCIDMMASNKMPRQCKRCGVQHFEIQGPFQICRFCGLYHYCLGDGTPERPLHWRAVTPVTDWLNPDHAALAQSDPGHLIQLAQAFNAHMHEEKANASRLRIFGPKPPSPQDQSESGTD
jgi:hypothetical protein